MKDPGSTRDVHSKLSSLSIGEGGGIPGVAVECIDIGRNTSAKAPTWPNTDAQARKLGEQTGLDTLVVLAVNGEH